MLLFSKSLFRVFITGLMLLFLVHNSQTIAQNAIKVNAAFKESTLENKLRVLVGKPGISSPRQIPANNRFLVMENPTLNLGFDNSPVWGNLVVENISDSSKNLILQFRKSFIDTLQLFQYKRDSIFFFEEYRWTQSYKNRPYPDINPTFELSVDPHSKVNLFFKAIKISGSWHLVPTLYDKKYYEAIYSKNLMLQTGIMLGIFFLGFFFVVSFYFLSRLNLFLYYAIYQVFFVLFYFSATEFFHYFLSGKVPLIFIDQFAAVRYQLPMYLLYGFFSLNFFKINQRKNHFIFRLFLFFGFAVLVSFISSIVFSDFLANKNEFYILINFLGLALFVIILACIYYGFKNRVQGTNSYTLAQSPIFLALIFWSFSNLGILPKNQNFTLIFGLAFLVENLLMLSVLAIQLRYFIKEKEKKFTSEIVEALENERTQIAMNLHDELGGSLSTVKRKLEDVISMANNQAHHFNELTKIFEIINFTNRSLRRISHNLAPAELQRLGLVKSLEQLCNSISNSNLTVDFYHSGKSSKLSHKIEVNLYRITSEALQNILKHSGASNADVSINIFEQELNLIVSDNGSWKVSEEIGMGLKNIRLRVEYLNGILNIDKSSKGTQLTVELFSL